MNIELGRRSFLASLPALAALPLVDPEPLNWCKCYTESGHHFATFVRYENSLRAMFMKPMDGVVILLKTFPISRRDGYSWLVSGDQSSCPMFVVSWDDPNEAPEIEYSTQTQDGLKILYGIPGVPNPRGVIYAKQNEPEKERSNP